MQKDDALEHAHQLIKGDNSTELVPISFIQKQLWLYDAINPESCANNNVLLFNIVGELNINRLSTSIESIYRHATIFHSKLESNEQELILCVKNNSIPKLQLTELLKVSLYETGILTDSLTPYTSAPFNTTTDYPIKSHLFKIGENNHLLLFVIHQSICDFKSKKLLMQEISKSYLTNNSKVAVVPQKAVSYEFEEEWSIKRSNTIKFWQDYLSGCSVEKLLPSSSTSSLSKSKGRVDTLPLTNSIKQQIGLLTEQFELSIEEVMLSAYFVLLNKYSGIDDINIGIPFDLRVSNVEKNTYGCFENFLPLRAKIEGGSNFIELVKQIRKERKKIAPYKSVPFEELVIASSTKSTSNEYPLFQAGFQYTPQITFELAELEINVIEFHNNDSQLDLFLTVSESKESELNLSLQYKEEFHEQHFIKQLLAHYAHLIEQLVQSPEMPINKIEVLTHSELQQMCIDWNARSNLEFNASSFLSYFSETAQKYPSNRAISFEEQKVSYRKLDEQSNQLANYLTKVGVEKETLVGLCMIRSTNLLVSVLGILKAGAAFLPLDPSFPVARLNYMLDQSEVKVIIADPDSQSIFKQESVLSIIIDQELTVLRNEATTPVQISVDKDDLAYVLYTSGSTGKPKGVQITHGALLNFLLAMQAAPGMKESDIIAAVTTLSFDISLLELLLPIITGASIILIDSKVSRDGQLLKAEINNNNVNFMQATPSTWHLLLCAEWKCQRSFKILCGGEALPEDIHHQLTSMSDQVWNMYGPTETTIWSTCHKLDNNDRKILIGKPIQNTATYILDRNLRPVPKGVAGELFIGGEGVSKGYLNRQDLTDERFIKNPLSICLGELIYKTGDLCQFTRDGKIEYLGRLDSQVKVRGLRIELGEIEELIKLYPGVLNCVVVMNKNFEGDPNLVANIVAEGKGTVSELELKNSLLTKIPDYMVPNFYNFIDRVPLTPNGKIDRLSLAEFKLTRPELSQQYFAATTEIELKLESIWRNILGVEKIGVDDNFFELGGNSLRGILLARQLKESLGVALSIVQLFEYPTIRKQASFLENQNTSPDFIADIKLRVEKINASAGVNRSGKEDIAIVGIGINVPGANSAAQFWNNLCNDVESITEFTREELAPFVEPELLNDPNYVLHRGLIDDIDKFDANFFGINPNEAKLMDPQQRVFLQLAWAALENAGYNSETFKGHIGVFADVGDNHYYTENVLQHSDLIEMVGRLIVEYGNMKDYIASRVSYNLNLTGPGINLNSACSGALTAIDGACKSLQSYECDMALAGGIDITVPNKSGFLYQKNGTFCKDGHCRPFDAEATGTMFCDGAGIVVLKRLSDAIQDSDQIYAVIKSTAINNDGSDKGSFLAPSVEGQSRVIALAQAKAGVVPEQISYIEAHGTGTPIGDPIEVEGLTRAFRAAGATQNQYCYLGSVKGHVGHPTNSSGAIAVIKTALALFHEKLPSTLHYKNPNPKIDFENTPFKVVAQLTPWKRGKSPRIAGISSFGFGGTNVHAILQEAPFKAESDVPSSILAKPCNLLLLSAKTPDSLNRMTTNLAQFLQENPNTSLADAAYTLKVGRINFGHRRFVVATNDKSAYERLNSLHPSFTSTKYCEQLNPKIVFMFPGQGAQYIHMGREFYAKEPTFKDTIDQCAELLKPHLHQDIRNLLYTDHISDEEQYDTLKNTYYTQPAIFVIEYALAKMWMGWGIKPSILIGHSVGEFVCAVLSGIFELKDALKLIALRGKLISDLPKGSMLSVRKAALEIEPLLPKNIQLAASNAPNLCVVAGPDNDLLEFSRKMEEQGIITKQLHTSHAFHSVMMTPAVESFINEVRKVTFSKPNVPFYSTTSLKWFDETNYNNPEYWGSHMCNPVRFSEAISTLLKSEQSLVFLEVGPRNTLTALTRQHMTPLHKHIAINSLSDQSDSNIEWTSVLYALGTLWANGIEIEWSKFYDNEKRSRIPLPTYSFEKTRHWVESLDKSVQSEGDKNFVKKLMDSETNEKIIIEQSSSEQTPYQSAVIGVRKLISGIYGKQIEHFDDSVTFMEMGMDSLFLTQFAFVLKKEYRENITFSHLMIEYPNIELLATMLESKGCFQTTNLSEKTSNQEVPEKELQLRKMNTPELNTNNSNYDYRKLYKLIQSGDFSKDEAAELAKLIKERCIENRPFENSPADNAFIGRDSLGNPAWFSIDKEEKYWQYFLDESGAMISKKEISFNPLKYGKVVAVLPVTNAQSEIFLFCKKGDVKASCAFNQSISFNLEGAFDVEFLKLAIFYTLNKHESLRLTISADGSYLLVNDSADKNIETEDLSQFDDEETQQKIEDTLSSDSALPFDLTFGPLIRFKILITGQSSLTLVFTAHHIICDGWSLDVILKDIATGYTALKNDDELSLEPPFQFSEYLSAIPAIYSDSHPDNSIKHWKERFLKAESKFELPYDNHQVHGRTFESSYYSFIINEEVVDRISQLSKKSGVSIFTMYFSAFNILMSRVLNQPDVLIGLLSANQATINKHELVGHCVNMLPILSEVDKNDSLEKFCSAMQRRLLNAIESRSNSYESVVSKLAAKDDKIKGSRISVGFTNTKKYEEHELEIENLECSYDWNPKRFDPFDIYVDVQESQGTVMVRCQFNSNTFQLQSIKKWFTDYEAVIEAIASNPTELIQNIGLRSQPQIFRNILDTVKSNEVVLENRNVIVLRKGSTPTTLFCLYGVLLYKDLADSFDESVTICGVYLQEEASILQESDNHSAFKELSSVESIAEAYMNSIISYQKSGPYNLCGASFGGVVALEVARKLNELGEVVNFVAMFDSFPPKSLLNLSFSRRVSIHLKLFKKYRWSYIVDKINSKFSAAGWNQDYDSNDLREEARDLASRNYHPKKFSGPVILFKSKDGSPFRPEAADLGWGTVIENLELLTVDGDHLGILKKCNVSSIVDFLQKKLN